MAAIILAGLLWAGRPVNCKFGGGFGWHTLVWEMYTGLWYYEFYITMQLTGVWGFQSKGMLQKIWDPFDGVFLHL